MRQANFFIALFVFLLAGYLCAKGIAYQEAHLPGEAAPVVVPSADVFPDAIRFIPDGLGNLRSAALTAEELENALATGRIRYVIRLNGDGKNDRGPISTAEERAICAQYGVEYVTSPGLPFFDGHAGYEQGRGYVKSYERAQQYLRRGGVLIHCRHGHDRTGAIVGAWLAHQDYNFPMIITHNNWQGYGDRGAAYAPYMETVRGQLEKVGR
ncbi:hypothetical protein [Lewinella sp. W8]|uniref:hypothetical protein n=1 Tax=Lewinella sp. W8 TaxID=2528208 RepID=UPI00106761DF|nr:hypothetical protein [Lewinella sp. W8]MTB49809.1 hypothetical protein [Lewinella sp. W8]